MVSLRSILLIILLVALLTAPLATAQPNAVQREQIYQGGIERLPATQNSDGGFGPKVLVEQDDGNTTNATQASRASFLQTVLTVHLLVLEETDRLDTWTNHDGVSTSLARSNATSARDWLQQYEKQHEEGLTPGDDALLALAYHDLGDGENARKILIGLLDEEAAGVSRMGAMDVAQVLVAQSHAGFALNATQNATIEALHDRLDATTLHAPELLSWALLARPDHGNWRAELASRLSGDLSLPLRALGAWALAASGGADVAAEEAIVSVHSAAPPLDSLAGLYLLLAERTANPHFSVHVSLVEGGATKAPGARAEADPVGTPTPQDSPADSPLQEPGPEQDDSTSNTFPVPAWLMMGIIVVALAVLLVTGLAYGLKREDLDGPRKDIFDYIDSHPGEHFSKIRRDLGLAPGTFQHHLSVLESGGWITSYKDARYKRYFVNGNRYKQMIAGYQYKQKFAALANGTTRDLVQFVREHPGVTQKEVALRLNLHASTVNWHANRLKQAGILNPERVGREVRYHVDPDLVKKMMQYENN